MTTIAVSSGECLKCGQQGNVWGGVCFECIAKGENMVSDTPKPARIITHPEADLQKMIIDLAHVRGWLVHAERPAWTAKGYRTAIQGDAGFPDLVMVREKRTVYAELKSEQGRLSEEQAAWIAALQQAKNEVFVWHPSDWDEIVSILQ